MFLYCRALHLVVCSYNLAGNTLHVVRHCAVPFPHKIKDHFRTLSIAAARRLELLRKKISPVIQADDWERKSKQGLLRLRSCVLKHFPKSLEPCQPRSRSCSHRGLACRSANRVREGDPRAVGTGMTRSLASPARFSTQTRRQPLAIAPPLPPLDSGSLVMREQSGAPYPPFH